jgi:relaxase-like protein
MINVQSSGKHFDWLVAYLLRAEAESERVGWSATRNLPTDDPRLAAVFMQATAAQSTFVQKPVYQIVLSFAPQDPVDRAVMERVADRVLVGLGLGEHQALLVAHQDRPHAHLHIVVNRVHPDTGTVWTLWQDWRRVRQVLSEEERALGLRPVSSRLLLIDAVAQDLQSRDRLLELVRAQYQADLDARAAHARLRRLNHDAEWARTTRAACDRALARVYMDPARAYQAYVAAAEASDRTRATHRMREEPERFGALVGVERTHALGLWRTVDEEPARAAAPAAAAKAAEALEAAVAWQRAADAAAHRLEEAFDHELQELYVDARGARAKFDRLAAEQGAERIAAALRERPVELGTLRLPVGEASRSAARAAACAVEAIEARALAIAAHAPGGPAAAVAIPPTSRAEAKRATERAATIRGELRTLPGRIELERRIGAAMEQLLPRELRLLRRAISAPQYAVAVQLRRTARDIALGRENDLYD